MSTASTNVLRPLNRNRLIATAARKANSRQKNTAMSVIERLMPSAVKNEPSSSTSRSSRTSRRTGTNVGMNDCSVRFDSSDEFIIQ